MDAIEFERLYLFIRPSGAGFDVAEFTQFSDESALLIEGSSEQKYKTKYRRSPEAWREAFTSLEQSGYIRLTEAVRTGMISKEEADCLTAQYNRWGA